MNLLNFLWKVFFVKRRAYTNIFFKLDVLLNALRQTKKTIFSEIVILSLKIGSGTKGPTKLRIRKQRPNKDTDPSESATQFSSKYRCFSAN